MAGIPSDDESGTRARTWLLRAAIRRRNRLAVVLVAVIALLAWTALAGGTEPADTYWSTVEADAPAAQYRLGDAAESTTLADSAGTDTATNSAITLGGDGPFPGSKSGAFSGEAYATLTSDPIERASEFTAEAWVDWTGGASYEEPIFDFGSSATDHMYLTPASTLAEHEMAFVIQTSAETSAQVTAPALTAGGWHFLALTETSAGTLTLYLNGKQVGQVTGQTLNPSSLASVTDAYLGKSLAGAPGFHGSLSNVAFYAKALSAGQIEAHYHAGEFPVDAAAPTISGAAEDEAELTAHAEDWTGLAPIEFGYQWLRCNASGESCSNIPGAGEQNYRLAHEDIEHTLRVEVTGTNAAGDGTARSAPTEPIAVAFPRESTEPTISGVAEDEQTLSVDPGVWTGTPPITYAYHWQRCDPSSTEGPEEGCTDRSGATSSTYEVQPSDVGWELRVWVTGSNTVPGETFISARTSTILAAAPTNTAPPTVSGSAEPGQTMSAVHGSWTGTPTITYAYQWQRCNSAGESCGDISGATHQTYALSSEDLSATVRVKVAATNSRGTADAFSSPSEVVEEQPPTNTAPPTISGVAEVGQELSATSGTWSGTEPITYAYQWQSCDSLGESCLDISGATSESYETTAGDTGGTLRVSVTATNAGGATSSTSESSPVVISDAPVDLGYVTQFGEWGSGEGQFRSPVDVTAAKGHLWVLEQSGNRVQEFSEAGEFQRQFGSEGSGDGQLYWPYALAVDSEGDVWVLDSNNGRIEEFGAGGEFIRTAGEGHIGWAEGIAVDRHDRIWVADTHDQRLLVFDKDGNYLKTVEPHGAGELSEPAGISIGANGHVWVADPAANRLLEFNEAGEYVSKFGTSGTGAGEMSEPYGVALWSGHIFLSEFGGARVQEFSEAGEFEAQLGVSGSGAGEISFPIGLSTDSAKDVWIADNGNSRVEEWAPETPGEPANLSPPAIEGIAGIGSTLTASPGAWRGSPKPSYAYQWERCNASTEECTNVEGATSENYVLEAADLGDTLRVTVTATNTYGSVSSTSSATEVIGTPPTDTTLPTISGTAQEGATLTAIPGSWEGTEPVSFYYQWQRCNAFGEECVEIERGSEESYTSGEADFGHTLRVTVYAYNSAGEATAHSAPTSVIIRTPPANLSTPEVVGTARTGATLVARPGSWSGAPAPTYSYQWELCEADGSRCGDINGATSASYAIESADLEGTLRVIVTANNRVGSANATSVVSAVVASGPPGELRPPAVEGGAQVGQALQADPGEWDGAELQLSYQWQLCDGDGSECSDIAGATGPEYDLTSAELGHALRLEVGASTELGSVVAISAATVPVESESGLSNTWAPTITGTPQVSDTLTASTGSWLGVEALAYSYQWQLCDTAGEGCADVEGATEASYTPGEADAGHTLRVLARASEEHGASATASATSPPIAGESAPVSVATPSLVGTPLVGYSLAATDGEWSGGTGPLSFAYQWERCDEHGGGCSPISGATSGEYTPSGGDADVTLRAQVTASDAHGHSSSATSTPLLISGAALHDAGAPSLSGPHQVDRPVKGSPGIWTGTGAIGFSFQWQRCNAEGAACTDITGANEAEYTPTEADAGHTLRARVHASDGSEAEDATSPVTAVIASDPIAPESEVVPSIEGDATVGNALTAQAGKWLSSETIEYAYQWQRCDEEGESCANIEGATGATYTLAEEDAGKTLQVVITAHNALGSAEADSEATEAVATPGPPANAEAPSILGAAVEGSPLAVDDGKWTGSRPLHYRYQWQRCDAEGEACAAIEGATATNYTPPSSDVGSRLRVVVSAENSVGTSSVTSTATEAVVTHETAGGAHAVERAEESDPSALAKAEPASVEAQTVTPTVTDPGEELHSDSTLTSADISKDTPGELALDTSGGEIALAPVGTAPGASAMPTVANETAAVFAGTFPDTDTIVRPDALGATTLLQLHSAAAPTSFSWEVGLGVNQELEQLPDGSVAVVERSTPSLEGPVLSEVEPAPETEPSETETEARSETSAEEDLEGAIEEEGPLEKLAAAPQIATPSFTPKPTEPHPQDTAAQAERDTSALTYAEEHASATVLMVIAAPTVLDAEGHSVAAHLAVSGSTVTFSITPEGEPHYPLIATESLAAPSDQATLAAAHSFSYGLSDQNAPVFESLDPKLKTGPGNLHIGIARYVVPYNVAYHPSKMSELTRWLKAVGSDGLEPYLTLGTLRTGGREFCNKREACPAPSAAHYKADLVALVSKLNAEQAAERAHNAKVKAEKTGTEESVVPSVQLWGAWNEPDLNLNKERHRDPLYNKPGLAAQYWEIAQSIVRCGACRVVAGEFAEDSEQDHIKYIESYLTHILHDHYHRSGKPRNVGFHDYRDLVHVPESLSGYDNPAARTFLQLVKRRFGGHAHILFSEQGVELDDGEEPTRLDKHKTSAYKHRQLLAAEDFARLADVSRNVDVVDYYLYRGPAVEPGFDSALIDGKTGEQRPAYCYLVLGQHGCGAHDATNGHVADRTTSSASTVLATVEPNGLPTKYWIEWGTTTAYGHKTETHETSQSEGTQSETVALSGLSACTTYHYRTVAENEANGGEPSLGEDETFTTIGCGGGKEPVEIASGTVTFAWTDTNIFWEDGSPRGWDWASPLLLTDQTDETEQITLTVTISGEIPARATGLVLHDREEPSLGFEPPHHAEEGWVVAINEGTIPRVTVPPGGSASFTATLAWKAFE
jgi:sugar lactone lactonase YvrE